MRKPDVRDFLDLQRFTRQLQRTYLRSLLQAIGLQGRPWCVIVILSIALAAIGA
jgi:hypothetical protein